MDTSFSHCQYFDHMYFLIATQLQLEKTIKTLIATPASGGNYNLYYLQSLISTINAPERLQAMAKYENNLEDFPWNVAFYGLGAEALISRGRNRCAQEALDNGFDKLFFIDADVGWTWEQFKVVMDSCNAAEGRGIVAGSCPIKSYPITLNFLPFPQDEKYFEPDDMMKTPHSMRRMSKGRGSPLVEVPVIGCAFMCVDIKVYRDLKKTQDYYVYPNPDTGKPQPHWDFHPVGPIQNQFVSEDWGLCHYARKAGHKVWLRADVCVTHTGNHTFRTNLAHVDQDLAQMVQITNEAGQGQATQLHPPLALAPNP